MLLTHRSHAGAGVYIGDDGDEKDRVTDAEEDVDYLSVLDLLKGASNATYGYEVLNLAAT